MLTGVRLIGMLLTARHLRIHMGMPARVNVDRWAAHVGDIKDAPVLADAEAVGATCVVACDKHLLDVDHALMPCSKPEALLATLMAADAARRQAAPAADTQDSERPST